MLNGRNWFPQGGDVSSCEGGAQKPDTITGSGDQDECMLMREGRDAAGAPSSGDLGSSLSVATNLLCDLEQVAFLLWA